MHVFVQSYTIYCCVFALYVVAAAAHSYFICATVLSQVTMPIKKCQTILCIERYQGHSNFALRPQSVSYFEVNI